MIITLGRSTTMTCVQLAHAGCEASTIPLSDIYIVMYRLGPGALVNEPSVWNQGCGKITTIPCGYLARRRVVAPAIKYCAFKRDQQGRVCFAWDDKLLKAPAGRWRGDLFVCEQLVGCLDFHLGDRFVAGSSASHETDCCPTVCS